MNKRLKKELRGEWRGGRDIEREREEEKRRERKKQEKRGKIKKEKGERKGEEEEEGEVQKKSNRCGACSATCEHCVHSEKVSLSPFSLPPPAQLAPHTPLPSAPSLHHYPNIPLGREQWLWCRVKML